MSHSNSKKARIGLDNTKVASQMTGRVIALHQLFVMWGSYHGHLNGGGTDEAAI